MLTDPEHLFILGIVVTGIVPLWISQVKLHYDMREIKECVRIKKRMVVKK